MYEARSAEYIQIYESIVIDFFLRLKIHIIGRLHVSQNLKKIDIKSYFLQHG